MANLNIFGKDWANLVFEGRNKEYGAYKLRKDNGKNTFLALILGILLMGLAFGSKTIYDKIGGISRASNDNKPDTEGLEGMVVELPDPIEEIPEEPEIKEEPPVEPPADASRSVQEEKELTEVTVKKDEEVKKQVKTSQEEFNDNTTSGRQDREADRNADFKTDGSQTGGADKGSKGTGTGDTFTEKEEDPNKIHRIVQQKAEPTDGMQNFYKKFINKFNAPEISSNVSQIKVTLKFVVEKDGSLTDIQVANDPHGAGKEAMRVLRTMPKWKPAQQNGKTVRSAFTLPITLKVN